MTDPLDPERATESAPPSPPAADAATPLWADGTPPSSRVPHLGHATLFLTFAFLVLLLSQLLLLVPHADGPVKVAAQAVLQPKRQILTMAIAYVATVGFCFLAFPLFWRREFLAGVHWNGAKALRLAKRLVPLGFALGLTVQAISSLIPMPKSIPMDQYFRSRSDVWLVTAFGVTLAPLFEELCFRGFLLPAFTIAIDWLGPLLRDLARFSSARLRGGRPEEPQPLFPEAKSAGLAPDTDNLTFRSRTAIVGASIVTSILFALLHAEQLAHAWAAVFVLFCVSLALTAVRVRTRSLACSTLVHASYNLSVFFTLFLATGGYRHLEKMTQ